MRHRIEKRNKPDGPAAIRTGVWLVVFGLVVLCVFTIDVSRRHTSQPTTATASRDTADQDASPRPRVSVRRTAHKKFTAKAYKSGTDYNTGESPLSIIDHMIQDRRTWVDTGHNF